VNAPKSKARAIVREEIPRTEQVIGALIMGFLVVLGIGLYLKGQRYDPHRFALDPAALESTRAEVTGKAATLRASDMRGFEQVGRTQSPSTPAKASRVLPAMVESVSPMGETEHYLPDNLFEKINGRAPAYLEFNFQELTCRSFTIDGISGQFIDVYIYTMDTPLNAFGIFSLERDSSAIAVDFVQDGYRGGMGYFLRQGKAYIQVIASDSAPAVMGPTAEFAMALAASIPVDNTGLGTRSLLPVNNQISDSENYVQSDAYGLSLMKDVYEAQYRIGGSDLTFFAMQSASADEAVAAWNQLEEFNRNYAEIIESGELEGARYLVSDNFGEMSVLFTRDQMIGGVVNAQDAAAARQFVEAYLRGEELEQGPGIETVPESIESTEDGEDYGF